MVTDLPDYSKKVIVIYEGTITGGEVLVDHRKILGVALKTPTIAQCLPISIEHVADINHKQILGEALKTPTFANSIPTSIENDAIAYDSANDRFYIDIAKISATDIITVAQQDKDRTVTGTVTAEITDITKTATSKYLTPTALGVGGTATIWTPAGGKAIRAKRIQVSVDAATRIDFRWTATAFESYYLPINGSVVVNLIGSNEQPAANATLTILSSAAANVTAKASGDEV